MGAFNEDVGGGVDGYCEERERHRREERCRCDAGVGRDDEASVQFVDDALREAFHDGRFTGATHARDEDDHLVAGPLNALDDERGASPLASAMER